MNSMVASCSLPLPATSVLHLSPDRRVAGGERGQRGAETVLAGVRLPPRAAEARPLGALLPEVLAAYGIAAGQQTSEAAERFEAVA